MQLENCVNCGGTLNPANSCDYCGTGAKKLLKRIARGAAKILLPDIGMTPKQLREVSEANKKELDDTCDISNEVKAINKLIENAVKAGKTKARFTLTYANMSDRKKQFVREYYKDQGFKITENWYVSPDEVKQSNFWASDADTRNRVYIFVGW